MQNRPTFQQMIVLIIVSIIISIALRVAYIDYLTARIPDPELFVLLLASGYVAHLQLKLGLHGRRDTAKYLIGTYAITIGLSLIPIFVHHAPVSPAGVVESALLAVELTLNPNTMLPILLLAFIEGLLFVFGFIFHHNRPKH